MKILVMLGLLQVRIPFIHAKDKSYQEDIINQERITNEQTSNSGIENNDYSTVIISRNKSPEENIRTVIKKLGGINSLISSDDVVVIKPNAQWWNQGTTNTNCIKGFIDLVLQMPGFKGEIIIAENHHYKEKMSRGWTTRERNGDFNLQELIEHFNNKGYKNVTKYHWYDGGPNPYPRQGGAGGGGIVTDPEGEDGYVWMEDEIYISGEGRKCMMTYPIFTSTFSGKKIDLMQGVYESGQYSNKLKLINFACLNHHSKTFGVTASIKNLMGIVDMTCGYHGTQPKGFFNMHYIGKESPLFVLGNQLKYYGRKLNLGDHIGAKIQSLGSFSGHYTGGALGFWMKRVRMPDLHILAAENVGWGDRLNLEKKKKVKTVLVSKDPVALDYIGAKFVLLTATPNSEKYYANLNNPDNPPFRLFLEECHKQGIGTLNEKKIKVIETVS